MDEEQTANAAPEVRLDDIQANILRSHGREHTRCLFLRLEPSPSRGRAWLSRFADQLTSAEKQAGDAARRRQEGADGGTVVCFFLSAAGFDKLGFAARECPSDPSFRAGMRHGHVNASLQDPVPGEWEGPYRQPIDALVLLADDNPRRLGARHERIAGSLESEGAGEVLFTESGKKLTAGPNQASIEHFGFLDGISQPRFFDDTGALIPGRQRIALTDEPGFAGGSYFVFRKLEQDVRAFREKMAELAQHLGMPGHTAYAEAQVMGRFRDGTPLSLFNAPANHPTNEFDYSGDDAGWKCPLHAHIRKTCPRNAAPPDEVRIIRRGVPYGTRRPDLLDEPSQGVGLLFMSYQASIAGQFEFISKNWCNNVDYPSFETGIDPLIGHRMTGPKSQHWNLGWNAGRQQKVAFSLRDAVRLLGGDYFFAPAISWLRDIESLASRGGRMQRSAPHPPGAYPGRRRFSFAAGRTYGYG